MRSEQRVERASNGWFILGLFLPLIGLILFLAWRRDHPSAARKNGWGALVGVIVQAIIAGIAAFFLLVAASPNVEAPKASASSAKAGSSKVVQKAATLNWSQSKDNHLSALMNDFGVSMNQNYTAVTKNSDGDWFQDSFTKLLKQKKLTVDGTTQPVRWLPTAKNGDPKHWNVMAVYADTTSQILYLFALKADGTHEVLVTQQAASDGILQVKPTANTALRTGFTNIMNGQKAAIATSSSSSSAATTKQSDHKPVFSGGYLGTWYGILDGKLMIMTIEPNALVEDNKSYPVYWSTEQSEADKKIRDDYTQDPDPERMNWSLADQFTNDNNGLSMIHLEGWYQSAGAGSYYWLEEHNIDGTQTPVLASGSGAEAWVDLNYYRDRETAQKMGTTIFSGQHTRDDLDD